MFRAFLLILNKIYGSDPGLESTQAALQTALTSLAAEVTKLQESLDSAATSSDVADLTAALDKVKEDLADLLASNNVYTPDATNGLVINSAASLEVAKSLGGKLSIINGSVNITNTTATALNAADLQAVLDKMVTITGTMTYTQSGTGPSVNFDALTSAGNLSIDNEHAISLAKLSNVGVLNVTADDKITSFSAPSLSSVTFASHTLDLRKATLIDLSSLAAYGTTGATTLTINGNNVSAGYDLKMPLFQDHGTDEIVRGITLNIGGYVNNLTLPLMKYKTSTITANDAKIIVLDAFNGTLTSGASSNHVDVTLGAAMKNYTGGPKLEKVNITGILTGASVTGNPAEGPDFNFDASSKLVSATISGEAGDVSFDGNTNVETVVVSADAVQVGLTGATSLVSATISGDVRGNIDASSATSLETIEISGAANTITLSGNTSLTGVTLTGSAQVVSIDGASSLTSLDLGHTSAFPANASTGVAQTAATKAASLHIYDNDELTSIKADKVTTVGSLKIYDNPVLSSVSFDAITAPAAGFTGTTRIWVGATTSGATVTASKNKLEAQSIVEGEPVTLSTGASRSTATITSNSGLKDLASMIAAAKADTKNDVAVYFDNVDSYTTQAGVTTTDETGISNAKTRIADFASNTASTNSTRFPNSVAKSISGLADFGTDKIKITANGSEIELTQLSTETADQFISRVNGASGLTSASVAAGDIDEVGRIEIGTATTSAYTATILFGSTSYASATSTPTTAANAKVVLSLTASSTATTKALTAVEFARQINAATSLKMQSFNSTTYSNTGNYTTTTTNFHDLYVVAASGDFVTIQKKKTVTDVNPAPAGTATNTVTDRSASAPVFRMFNNDAAVFGTIYSKTNDYYVMVSDNLYGANNTPGLNITGTGVTVTNIVEEYATYAAATGVWATRTNGVPHHGLAVRATEVDIDGADSNARTAATNAYYVTTYYTWN